MELIEAHFRWNIKVGLCIWDIIQIVHIVCTCRLLQLWGRLSWANLQWYQLYLPLSWLLKVCLRYTCTVNFLLHHSCWAELLESGVHAQWQNRLFHFEGSRWGQTQKAVFRMGLCEGGALSYPKSPYKGNNYYVNTMLPLSVSIHVCIGCETRAWECCIMLHWSNEVYIRESSNWLVLGDKHKFIWCNVCMTGALMTL